MGAILAFVMGRPAWIAGGLALLLSGGLMVQTARLGHAKADQLDPASHRKWKDEYGSAQKALAAAEGDLQTCRANQTTLELSLIGQNAAVDRLKTEAEARTRAATSAAAAARAGAAKLDQSLAELKDARPAGADLCNSADALIRSFAP